MSTFEREIFMQNGSYKFCEILQWDEDDTTPNQRLLCKTDDGKLFLAKRAYGTWMQCRHDDPYIPSWYQKGSE